MTPGARTVLYVEDDAVSCELMAHIVALVPGWRLVAAGTLTDARRLLFGDGAPCHDAALVMVDLDLPDGNGVELVAELARTTSPPVVWVVTGDASHASAERLVAAGATAVVVKPYEVARLVSGLGHLLTAAPPAS